jgi:beta-galactosidase GanA
MLATRRTLMNTRFMIAVVLAMVCCQRAGMSGELPQLVGPPKIRVDRQQHGFVDAAGKSFVPFGVTYYRPDTGWAPQLWKQFSVEATRRDFARLKNQGANVVRVFVSFGSFFNEPGRLNPEGLAKFDQLLDLADDAGLYVHPTGPDAWEGMPAWTKDLNVFRNDCNEPCLRSLEDFWRWFAARYRGRTTIWAYDLRNEPHIAWNTVSLRRQWAEWREANHEAAVSVPDPKGRTPIDALADYQRFRESIAEKWVARQAAAIRAADPHALVTVGLLQWSVPAQRMAIDQYTGFRPSVIAKHLDFLELHFYPLVDGAYDYRSSVAETTNLAVLEAMARECAKPGLPLVIAEFGWYGGGPLNPKGRSASQQQQAQWCRHLVDVTSPIACGWLNWGMYDTPQATDVSRLTGLFTADGQEKVWGQAFKVLSHQFQVKPPRFAMPSRPDLPWTACTASSDEMEKFRQAYLAAFAACWNSQ